MSNIQLVLNGMGIGVIEAEDGVDQNGKSEICGASQGLIKNSTEGAGWMADY